MSRVARAGLLLLTVAAQAWGAPHHESDSDSASQAVLDLFRTRPIVALGMDHRFLTEVRFAETLVRMPGFAKVVNDVVFECANRRYQDLLDRYIAGGPVSVSDVAVVWRNATQVGRCDGSEGPELLATIREVNSTLPAARRIRVLAPDPSIDWSAIRSLRDLDPFLSARDTSITGTIEREVLARHRRALLVLGAGHVVRRSIHFASDSGAATPTALALLEQRHPGALYVIIPHQGFGSRTAEYENRMKAWTRPTLIDLKTHWPGEEPAGRVYTGSVLRVGQDPCKPMDPYPGSTLRDLADGFLYLGPVDSLQYVRPPSYTEADSAYLRELGRRRSLTPDGAPARAGGRGAVPVCSAPSAPLGARAQRLFR